ncbi:MAG: coproporphyrinogen III oxidase [Mariprofundus sp.]|nr:coproporphyrinogen III oxidase [Mariprofundus sp.]
MTQQSIKQRTLATSGKSAQALALVSALQQRFTQGLESLSRDLGTAQKFNAVEWFRDNGIHGGGLRYETADGPLFGRGSVNVSQVHYDDNPAKQLASATAISTIIHPCHPMAPSVHIHLSWTEMRNGKGYWRVMADLNPSHENPAATGQYFDALRKAVPEQFDAAVAQGERYFFIPALERHRGVAHFYLEAYNSGDVQADLDLATTVGETAIDTYLDILRDALTNADAPTAEQQQTQLAYHTLYFLQVLTLDRGTTSGLLVHDQNDVGILGSIPAYVDKDLLKSWLPNMQQPQDRLLRALIAALPKESPSLIDEAVKQKLANVVREHYITHPDALALQASGDVIPPTVKNHS